MRAAINIDIFARDISCFFGSKEHNRACNLEHLADALHRDILRELPVILFGSVHVLADIRIDGTRADTVDRDAILCDFAGKVLREAKG